MVRARCQKKKNWWMPLIILVAGVSLRGVYLLEIREQPEFTHPIYDPEYNAYWARALATGDWSVPSGMTDPEIRTTPHGRPPGYPWFLAAVYTVCGVNSYGPRVVQMLLGVANALLLYVIGRRLFGVATGFIAGLLMATYWVFPYFEGLLTYPSVAIFVLLLMILTLLHWRENRGWLRALLAGILLGIFALFRPNGLLIAPVILGGMCWVCMKKGTSRKYAAAAVLFFMTGCIGILIPTFVRNYVVARDFVFISAFGGINLYVGNHPESSLVEPRIPELMDLAGIEHWSCFDYPAIVRGLAAQQGRDSLKYSEANRYFYGKAIAFIAADPGMFLCNLGRKFLLLFGPYEITNDTVMEYDKHFSRVLGPLPGFPWVLSLFSFGLLLFFVATPYYRRDKEAEMPAFGWLLLLMVLFYSISVILYFVAGRYRTPIIPIMLLFAAYGMVRLWGLFRERHWTGTVAAVFALVVLILLAHWNPAGYTPSEATWHLRRAMAYTAEGEDAWAEKEYRLAESLGAESSIVYANLGRLHFEKGDTQQGLDLYNKGLEKNPNNAIIRNNLGYELYKLNYLDDAIRHLEHAVAVNPRFMLARINLGNALADKGDTEAALVQFREAMRLNPKEPSACYNTARMLFAKGDYTGAVALYRKTLELAPEYALALNNLGYCYAIQDDYETAIPLYERAIAVDPVFMLAYNNLGDALLAAGRTSDAERIFKQALDWEPENTYSQYRLGEIYGALQEWDKAIDCARKTLEISPEYVPALVQLGTAHFRRGENAQSMKALERAQMLSPEDVKVRSLLEEVRAAGAGAADASPKE